MNRGRQQLHLLVEHWNENAQHFSAALKLYRKSVASAVPTTNDAVDGGINAAIESAADISDLPILRSPYPAHLHLSLPPITSCLLVTLALMSTALSGGVAVVVRDAVDARSTLQPDLGSIIAYALASPLYDAERRRLRVVCSEESVPLTLAASTSNASLSDTQIRDDHLSHVDVCFNDATAQYYVKVSLT
jgi:hypothetical protein